MTFPTIPTSAGGRILSSLNTTGGATSTFPSLSSLTKNSGDLLIAIIIEYDGNSTNAEFSSWGGGFTEFVDQATTATMGIGAAYKWSTGSETGTFTVTTADTGTSDRAMILMSIPGAHASTPPEGGTITNGTSAAANIAALNPSGWDVEDTLWIAVGASGEDSTTGSFTGAASAPANYGGYFDTGISADVVGGVEGAVAFRQLRAASDDPGAFSVDTSSARNSALLIAVRPAVPNTPGPDLAVTESARDTTSPKSVVVSGCVAGDVLYVHAGGDAFGPTNSVTAASCSNTAGTTDAGAGDWPELGESLSSGSADWCGAYKAIVTANGDVTVQVSRTQAGTAGPWHVWVAKAANGTSSGENVHTKFTVDATEVINFAVTQDSAVTFASYDWDAVAPGTFTPSGATEVERSADSNYTEASAYWLGQAAGTRDYGTTGSAGTAIKAIAIEILAVNPNATVTPSAVAATAGIPTPGVTTSGNATATPATVTATAAIPTPIVLTGKKFVTDIAGTGTGQHFVDQAAEPILIRGYVLWGLLMNAGRWAGTWQSDLEDAVAALQTIGCNAIYTEPLGNTQNGGAFNNGNTWDGVAPFTGGDPATFNDTFWQRSDYLFDLCAAAGITVFFNFAYSDDLDTAALSAFSTADFTDYGTSLAARYKTRPNLVWMMGGDYFDTDNTAITAVKTAIRAEGDTHLFGVQNYPETTSRKDIENNATEATGTDNSEFNFVYSYNAIYWGIEYAWTESSPLPVMWGDGHFDQDTTADRKVMRDLTWWTFSSGGRGMIYGSEGTWAWASGALANLTSDTFPNTDLGGIWDLFTGFTNWHLLVPDTDSSFVTAGRGTKSDYVTSSGGGGGEYNSSDTQAPYVTAAITADGTLAVVYFPVDQTITVDDTELGAGYTATWVDPINGATSSATIASTYSPTGTNSLGGPDWLLVFESAGGEIVTPASVHAAASVPSATIQAGSQPTPAAVSAVASVPAPTVRLGVAISRPSVAAVAAIPTPAVSAGGSALAAPATVTATATIPAPTMVAGSIATPAAVNAVAAVPAPVVRLGAATTPATVNAVATIPTPTVRLGATITPATVTVAAAVPTPAVSAGGNATVAPAAVAAAAGIPAPNLTTSSTFTVPTVTAQAAIPAPTVVTGTGTTVAAAAVHAAAAIPAPTVRLGVLLGPAAVAASAGVPAPALRTSMLVPAFSVAAVVTIPAPTVVTLAAYTPLAEPVTVVRLNPAAAGIWTNPAAAAARPNPAEAP